EEPKRGTPGADYLSMLNAEPAALEESTMAPEPVNVRAPAKRGGAKPKGVVDAGRKAPAKRGRRGEDSRMKEL
ncbi:MAG TPA: hypothetical protein PLG14_06860, partial [Spirochaetales bacterium]|nr:hypothetical protein [Spirochaetales bacterium]